MDAAKSVGTAKKYFLKNKIATMQQKIGTKTKIAVKACSFQYNYESDVSNTPAC